MPISTQEPAPPAGDKSPIIHRDEITPSSVVVSWTKPADDGGTAILGSVVARWAPDVPVAHKWALCRWDPCHVQVPVVRALRVGH